jgi:hypothetical protein
MLRDALTVDLVGSYFAYAFGRMARKEAKEAEMPLHAREGGE